MDATCKKIDIFTALIFYLSKDKITQKNTFYFFRLSLVMFLFFLPISTKSFLTFLLDLSINLFNFFKNNNYSKWQKMFLNRADINASLTNPAAVMNILKAPLMSAGESSIIVSLYFVILFTQLWLTEPFQAACGRRMHHYEILTKSLKTWGIFVYRNDSPYFNLEPWVQVQMHL